MHAELTPGISSSLVTSSWANAKGIISQSEPPLNPSSFTSFYYKHQHISSSLFLITNIGLFSSPLKYTAWDTVSGHSSSYRNFLRTNLGILSTAHILSHILRHPDGQRHRMQTPCQVPPPEGGREQLFWGSSSSSCLNTWLGASQLAAREFWREPRMCKDPSSWARTEHHLWRTWTGLKLGMLDDGLFLTWSYPQY